MTLLGDLWSFLLAVIPQWQALVTGSFFTAALFIVERWRNVTAPRRTVIAVFVWGFLGTAAFLAWRDERAAFDRLEARTSDAQVLTLDQEQRMRAVLQRTPGFNVQLGTAAGDKRGRAFAERIRLAFSESGWGTGGAGIPSSGSGRSLRILADDPNTKTVSAIMTAFDAAGLRYRVVRVCNGTVASVEIGESDTEKAGALSE